MANPIKQLATLNAKTQSFDDGRGGVPELTPLDIAAGLAGLPDFEYQLARLKYVEPLEWTEVVGTRKADQELFARRITTTSKIMFADIAAMLSIKAKEVNPRAVAMNPQTFGKAVRLALIEHLNPKFANCPKCHGSGSNGWGNTCKRCKGEGKISIKKSEYADLLGVHRSSWQRTWGEPYGYILQILSDADNRIFSHLKRRLKTE